MGLGRKELSTRLLTGVFVLVGVTWLCVWSYLFDFSNKVMSFGSGLPLILPVIWWSWREIFSLKRDSLGKRMNLYSCVWCFLTVIPSLLLLGNKNDVAKFSNSRIAYAVIGLFVITVAIVLWGRLINRNVTWLDGSEWLRAKSLTCLMISAFLFWNMVFCMIICSLWYWMAFIFIVVMLNDSLAYLMGKKFGKRIISKLYSPHKTWEGLWFSFAIVYVAIILFWCLLPSESRKAFVGESDNWIPMIFLGAPMLLLCNLGDLQFSMHKRIFKIKDYSSILRKHGGFWDRFDSHTFAFVFWGLCALIWQAFTGSSTS